MSRFKLVGRSLLIGLLAGGSSAAVCNPVSIFACGDNEDCIAEAGEGAICEVNSYCSLPDEGCEGTMRRWHDRAANDIAGKCLEDAVGGTGADDGGSGSGTAAPGSTGDSADGSTGGGPGSTSSMTMPAEDTMGDDTPMTGDDMPMTDDGGSTSGGAQQTCDERYGGHADYMLCEETPDSCSFNATMNMMMSCNDVCEMYGGMCTGTNLNNMELCTSEGASTCDAADSNDSICICTRP